jgi:hypothetical protein
VRPNKAAKTGCINDNHTHLKRTFMAVQQIVITNVFLMVFFTVTKKVIFLKEKLTPLIGALKIGRNAAG